MSNLQHPWGEIVLIDSNPSESSAIVSAVKFYMNLKKKWAKNIENEENWSILKSTPEKIDFFRGQKFRNF